MSDAPVGQRADRRRVYLAGPDVFRPDARERLQAKKAVCARYGLVGISPFDNEVTASQDDAIETARSIYRANVAFMGSCAFAIANATPFRGISIDPGTAFEVGYMVALGRTVYAYSCDSRLYDARLNAARGEGLVAAQAGPGWLVEEFGLEDNLMIPLGVEASGGAFVLPSAPRANADEDGELRLFARCAEAISTRVSG